MGSRTTERAKDVSIWVTWVERGWRLLKFMSPAASISVATWATKFFHPSQPWVYWLVFLGALNAYLMVMIWSKLTNLRSIAALIDPKDAAEEKQRKRDQIRKWREMLIDIGKAYPEEPTLTTDLLWSHIEFLSLEPHLPKHILLNVKSRYEPNDFEYNLGEIHEEICRIARSWGVE